MLEPKNTLVGLAGQKAWHIWTGEALPRIKGKYRPSQLRTQKAGPEPATAWRSAGAAWDACGFRGSPNRKSSRPSAEAAAGASALAITAAESAKRRRLR